MEFVGLGYCGNDYLSLLPEIPLDGKVRIERHLVQGGGPSATAAVAAARLGMASSFIGVVGDDEAGGRIRRELEAEGVCTRGMMVRPGASSAVAYCWVDSSTGKRSIAWTRGSAEELGSAEVDMALVRGAGILHLDGHQPQAALAAAKEARKHAVPVSLDAGTLCDGIRELLPQVTILIASEAFARAFTGETDLERAAAKLSEYGADVTGVTMGSGGSLALSGGKLFRCPAFEIEAVDTTGAGDVFHGAFCVRWLETHDVGECLRFASAVSALKCLQFGGRSGIPRRPQVEDFLRNH